MPGVSNLFASVGHIYALRFYAGRIILDVMIQSIFSKLFTHSTTATRRNLTVSTLAFLQPQQTENQFNRHFGTQGFQDLFKRQTRQNPFNPIGKWLSGKFNQVHYQTKTSTTQPEPGSHSEKMPSLLTHSMDRKRFDEVRKADHVCRETLLLFR